MFLIYEISMDDFISCQFWNCQKVGKMHKMQKLRAHHLITCSDSVCDAKTQGSVFHHLHLDQNNLHFLVLGVGVEY